MVSFFLKKKLTDISTTRNRRIDGEREGEVIKDNSSTIMR
jgi:hypothetical protein